jgi:hypothetical protein
MAAYSCAAVHTYPASSAMQEQVQRKGPHKNYFGVDLRPEEHDRRAGYEPDQRGEALAQVVNLLGEVIDEVTSPCDGLVNDIYSMPRVQPGEWLDLVGEVVERIKVVAAELHRAG